MHMCVVSSYNTTANFLLKVKMWLIRSSRQNRFILTDLGQFLKSTKLITMRMEVKEEINITLVPHWGKWNGNFIEHTNPSQGNRCFYNIVNIAKIHTGDNMQNAHWRWMRIPNWGHEVWTRNCCWREFNEVNRNRKFK